MDKQEAIKILKEFHDKSALFSVRTALETVLPELKESEDEKIRKELIQYIKNWKANIQGKAYTYLWSSDKEECNKLLAWLEKQGGTSKEWTISDAATFKELIDFLENGTAKLQHDITRYANWLKIQLAPIEKQGKKNPVEFKWSTDDKNNLLIIEQILNCADLLISSQELTEIKNWLKSLKQRIGG